MNDAERPRDFHRRWPTLRPPLRPAPAAVAAVAQHLAGIADSLVLLGVTPELAALPRAMIAVDWSADMIALAWPGDSAARRALLGDWKALPLPDASVGGAMGDGALTMLGWPDEQQRVLAELARVVRPGGRVVLRCFATPEPAEPVAAVAAAALTGALPFHLFKLRFNMAAAREVPALTISSATLYDRFDALLPDGPARAATGWSETDFAEMAAYRGSAYRHAYPTRSELLTLAREWPGTAQLIETHDYPGAEHCPLLVLDRA